MTSQPVGVDAPTTVSIAAGPLVGPILRRVVGMLAARADLPLDRLDDAVLVADLIAARAPAHVLHGTVDVAFQPGPRTLSLRVGPLRPGGGDALVIDAGATHVIVDRTETTFIDSSSLGVLIGAHRRLLRLQGRLVVVCNNDAIVKTFRITGLDGVFTIVPTLDEALNGDAVGA